MEQAIHGPAQVEDGHAVASAGAVVACQQQREASSAGEGKRYGYGVGVGGGGERQSVSSFGSPFEIEEHGRSTG
jgi:hypothetical protein